MKAAARISWHSQGELAQLSYWSAKHLGDTGLKAMQERGRVQVGKVADLTLFNPKTVEANATYKAGENGLSPTGIPYVIVHGRQADGQRRPFKPHDRLDTPQYAGKPRGIPECRWFEVVLGCEYGISVRGACGFPCGPLMFEVYRCN